LTIPLLIQLSAGKLISSITLLSPGVLFGTEFKGDNTKFEYTKGLTLRGATIALYSNSFCKYLKINSG
jgi:hydrogenase/urease accessory protein HupE